MNLFSQKKTVNSEEIKTLKNWIYQALAIPSDIPISISQLSCKEPGCPPVETVISVLKTPQEVYKIHKKIADIEYEDICQLKSTIY